MLLNVEKKQIHNPAEIASVFQSLLGQMDGVEQNREHLWVMGLNARNIINYVELVSIGTLMSSPASTKEIFATAVTKPVYGIILCHNHPSSDVEASPQDIILYKNIGLAAEIMDIQLLDFIIIGQETTDFYRAMQSLQNVKENVVKIYKQLIIDQI